MVDGQNFHSVQAATLLDHLRDLLSLRHDNDILFSRNPSCVVYLTVILRLSLDFGPTELSSLVKVVFFDVWDACEERVQIDCFLSLDDQPLVLIVESVVLDSLSKVIETLIRVLNTLLTWSQLQRYLIVVDNIHLRWHWLYHNAHCRSIILLDFQSVLFLFFD